MRGILVQTRSDIHIRCMATLKVVSEAKPVVEETHGIVCHAR
jgi:hypothetical protein